MVLAYQLKRRQRLGQKLRKNNDSIAKLALYSGNARQQKVERGRPFNRGSGTETWRKISGPQVSNTTERWTQDGPKLDGKTMHEVSKSNHMYLYK